MLNCYEEKRLKRDLPAFRVYSRARYVGPTRHFTDDEGAPFAQPKQIRNGVVYTGEFIVFPEAVLCVVRHDVWLQTKPQLWEFIEEENMGQTL